MTTITGLSASPRGRKSRTLALVEEVLDGARDQGAEVREIDLCEKDIGFCTGCESCSSTGRCVLEDDLPSILDALGSSDGIILGSPVYVDNVTGQMKAFVDRLNDAIHCQTLAGKYGCTVATTWGSGGEEVVKYLGHVLTYLGILVVGDLSIPLGDLGDLPGEARGRARGLGQDLVRAIGESRRFPDQEEEIAENRRFFGHIVVRNRLLRPTEYNRWVRNGWLPT